MLRTVLIDDEKHSIATLAWKLEKFCPDVDIIAQFTDPAEGLDFLEKNKIDLLFLDIEMPRLNGFELLDELENHDHFRVIFTTAYDEFGIKAIKANALDYLLKPIQVQELKDAVAKVVSHLPSRVEASSENSGKIALATKESIEFVAPEEIIFCKSDSNYTMIHLTDNRKKLISKTLKEVEQWLEPYHFYRSHLSYLVNVEHIREYIRADGGYLKVTDGHAVPVARNRKEELLGML